MPKVTATQGQDPSPQFLARHDLASKLEEDAPGTQRLEQEGKDNVGGRNEGRGQ